jgi:VWFA-related protein
VVTIRQIDERQFPSIGLEIEVRRPDGEAILDAPKESFQVFEFEQSVTLTDFRSPVSIERRATSVVLVVDRSRSMNEDDRMDGLKLAVRRFLETMPEGSKVAVIAFSSQVELLVEPTTEPNQVREIVDDLEPRGSTRFYDAVAAGLRLIDSQEGRRALVALTDGEDTDSHQVDLGELITLARETGVPVHTLGLGTEEEANRGLERLAEASNGRYLTTDRASELSGIFEEIARGLGETYSLAYRTTRELPDGTRRPIRVSFTTIETGESTSAQGEIYIPGLVVPAAGWSPLFLGIVATLLAALGLAPALRLRNHAGR